jgi:hypothetical protein
MMTTRSFAALGLLALLVSAPAIRGQQPNAPHAGYVYPAGARQGATIQVTVGGQFLNGVNRVLMSGGGVTASIVGHDRPLSPQQINALRESIRTLQPQANNPAVRRQIVEARARIADSLRRNTNPVLGETVTLAIAVVPDARPGVRQLRMGTPAGLSNPVLFCIDELPEFEEPEDTAGPAASDPIVKLPVIVNGRIVPRRTGPDPAARQNRQDLQGDVDRYRFRARRDQHLVVAASARALVPFLADAVPGWFQATVTLFDAGGRELAYEDDHRFSPDPVLHYQVPADGEYVVQIADALSRGRDDFVYRLAIGELPFVTDVFPLGGPSGRQTRVEVSGWNLPIRLLTFDARERHPGTFTLPAPRGAPATNRVPFVVDALPERLEREPNDAPIEAQRVALPVVINGRVEQPGDRDAFSFSGRAGHRVVAEVSARRLGSPLDSALELTDAAGRRVAWNDDHDDASAGLLTHHADSFVMATLPADGTYLVSLRDVQHKGGAAYAYRLRISPPRPDFELWIAPSSVNAAGGATVPVTVQAVRRDGFAGDIVLALVDAPPGFALSGGIVPAGVDRIRMTVTRPSQPLRDPLSLRIEGRGVVEGRTVIRQAAPADDMTQAFVYRHLVAADDLRVSPSGRGGSRIAARIAGAQPVRFRPGETARVRVALPPAYGTFDNVEFELADPPPGISLSEWSLEQGGVELVFEAESGATPAGLRTNLLVTVSGQRRQTAATAAPTSARRRLPLGTLPAIAIEVAGGR